MEKKETVGEKEAEEIKEMVGEKEEVVEAETIEEEEELGKVEGVEKPREEVEKPKIVGKKRGPGKVQSILIEKETEKVDAERLMTIRFYPRILSAPKWKRAKKAARVLRELVAKYVKYAPDPETGEKIRIKKPYVWISPKTNELIWSRGAKNPPRKIRVRVLVKFLNINRENKTGEAELRVFPI